MKKKKKIILISVISIVILAALVFSVWELFEPFFKQRVIVKPPLGGIKSIALPRGFELTSKRYPAGRLAVFAEDQQKREINYQVPKPGTLIYRAIYMKMLPPKPCETVELNEIPFRLNRDDKGFTAVAQSLTLIIRGTGYWTRDEIIDALAGIIKKPHVKTAATTRNAEE